MIEFVKDGDPDKAHKSQSLASSLACDICNTGECLEAGPPGASSEVVSSREMEASSLFLDPAELCSEVAPGARDGRRRLNKSFYIHYQF